MQGLLDVPLNETGQQQAQAVARALQDRYSFTAIYSSHLQRAQKTAQAIAARQNCPLYLHHQLQELDVGDWSGMTRQEIQTQYPHIWDQLQADPYHTERPGGESFAQLYTRVTDWFQKHIAQQPPSTYCIISHAAAIRALLAHVLDIPPIDSNLHVTLDNTGISVIEYQANWQNWQVLAINCTCHLQRMR